MTVADLIRILSAVPAEFRELPCFYTYHREEKPVEMVIIDPEDAQWRNRGAVYFSSGDDARARAAALIRVISVPPDDVPLADVCLRCHGAGTVFATGRGEPDGDRPCPACGGTGKGVDMESAR